MIFSRLKNWESRIESLFVSHTNKRLTLASLGLLLCLTLFIVFDAIQQQYYVRRYPVLSDYAQIEFFIFFWSHLINWTLWFIVGIPFMLIVYRDPVKRIAGFVFFIKYFTIIIIAIFLDTVLMGIRYFIENDNVLLNFNSFRDTCIFFLHQKLPVFFISYVGLLVLVRTYKEKEILTIRVQELKELSSSNTLLYNELKKNHIDSEKIISVKIGNRLKQVVISDIQWIESDNYCVKLHTQSGTFTIRASMKYLEKYLPQEKFIRVHRTALVNMAFIEELNTVVNPVLKLRSGLEIKVANSRLGEVRKRIRSEVA